MAILEFLSSPAGIVAEICATVLIVVLAALIATGKIRLKRAKVAGAEVEFNNDPKNKKEIDKVASSFCLTPQTVQTIMRIVDREASDSLSEIEASSEKYHDLIKKGDEKAVEKAIRNYLISFPKLFDDNDERNNIDTNELLELYLTKDINGLIIEKLEEIYEDPETKCKEEIELNGIAEDLAKEIIISLKCNIRNYRLLADTTDELNKLFDESARELLDYLKGAIQGYIKYSASEKEEKLALIKKRNDTITEQISNMANGGLNGNTNK